jgi:hypothetical protein
MDWLLSTTGLKYLYAICTLDSSNLVHKKNMGMAVVDRWSVAQNVQRTGRTRQHIIRGCSCHSRT